MGSQGDASVPAQLYTTPAPTRSDVENTVLFLTPFLANLFRVACNTGNSRRLELEPVRDLD